MNYLHDLEVLYLAGALNVRTPAQVNKSTTPVHGTLFTRHQLVDVVQLVFAVRKHLPKIFLCNLQAIEALLFFHDPVRLRLERGPVTLGDDTAILNVSHCNADKMASYMLAYCQKHTRPA